MECKTEARNIRNYDQQLWESSAKSLCYDGIKAKFTQNPWLANLLLSTNDEILAEATYDKVWETGIPLLRRDCTNRTQWNGIGIMGEILMAIREELRPTSSAIPSEQPMETVHADSAAEPPSNEGST